MFSNIKTSKSNKELVTNLTNKLNLGPENVIARLALSISIAKDRKLDLSEIQDSGGKEYSSKILLGSYIDIYISILCTHYNIHKTDKDIPRYLKMHLDDGLVLINLEVANKGSITGTDFLINQVEKSLINTI